MAGPTTTERGAEKPATSADPSARPSRPGPADRPRRLSGPRVVLLIVTALALVAAGIWMLYGSAWFRVEQVTVSGTRVLTPGEVEKAAAVPIGTPLISVDMDGIEEHLRRKLPRVDSVDVVRSWPHGIGLKVMEREPVLLVERGGKFIEVDKKGVRFATVEQAPKGVPLLELTVTQSPSLRRFGADRLTAEAVGVTTGLPEAVAKDVRIVRVRSYDSFTLELTGGRTVFWGSGEYGRAKARALTALMRAAPKAGHFDVSAPSAPAASRS